MRKRTILAVLAGFAVFAATAVGAQAAITVSRAELNSSQLRVEGSGALPNAAVTVDPGGVTGTSDSNGAFKIQATPYSSSTCKVTVSDSSTTASASLTGCTTTTTPPPPTAAPAVSLSPASLTYAAQDTGTTSASQLVTVSNTGTASLFINSAAVPNTLDFTVVNDGCSGLTLAVGTSCSVSITFSPSAAGTRSAALTVTDNAPNSPQTAPLTGTGTTPAGTTAPALAIDTQFMTCPASGPCDVAEGSSVFVNNFFTTSFHATGGTAPYTWSGTLPAGLTLRPSGLALGTPTMLGTSTFQITVTDAAGSSTTGTFSLTVTNPPAPTPPGCQTGGNLKEALTGSAFGGKTPSGQATADESQFSGCGGFTLLSVQVKDVSLPDGTVIWVTLDFKAVGTITVHAGSGTMATNDLGRFGVSRDAVRVYSSLPDDPTYHQILGGGFFK